MSELRSVIDWIIDRGLSSDSIVEILDGVSERLVAAGYPLLRSSIGMPAIDPMHRGISVTWSATSATLTQVQGHDDAGQEMFERSPIFHLISHDLQSGRWRPLQQREDLTLPPLLRDFAQQGVTDYALKLVAFADQTTLRGVGFSVATNSIDGFSDAQIDALDAILPALGLACYRIASTHLATDMLAIYTGARTSARILSGEIQRGAGTAIYAALMLADLKNFTALNESYQPERIVAWLNEHFEAIGGPVEAYGGEILKFMGDSLLAIFPADVDGAAIACRHALTAALDAHRANDALNQTRLGTEQPQIKVDIVLHVGEIFYGNVGSPRRLDFTAIGKAVNEASRIERLCDETGRSLLVSHSFAAHFETEFEKIGTFALRGVAAPADIYGLSGKQG